MTTFTIDTDNNITAFGTPEEAAATTTTPFDTFASEKELAELIAAWPAERLVAIWNSLPGVEPVKGLKSAKTAASRIWERIQGLGEAAQTEAEPAKSKANKKAKAGARSAKGAPAKAKATKKATAAKNAPNPWHRTPASWPVPCSISRSPTDRSANARHSPSTSGWPPPSAVSISAISRRQRAIHSAPFRRSSAISSNVRPSPSSLAFLPLSVCKRCTTTSTYFGSSSIPQQTRSGSAAASTRQTSG